MSCLNYHSKRTLDTIPSPSCSFPAQTQPASQTHRRRSRLLPPPTAEEASKKNVHASSSSHRRNAPRPVSFFLSLLFFLGSLSRFYKSHETRGNKQIARIHRGLLKRIRRATTTTTTARARAKTRSRRKMRSRSRRRPRVNSRVEEVVQISRARARERERERFFCSVF